MPDPSAILIPLLNANEPSSQLTNLYVESGDVVKQYDPIGTCESTKGVEDLIAPRAGFVCSLHAAIGDQLEAGQTLCWIADDVGWDPPVEEVGSREPAAEMPKGLHMTMPARRLADTLGLDIGTLPVGPMITEARLREMVEQPTLIETDLLAISYPENALIVYGGGGHGKSLIELIRLEGEYAIVGVIDDGIHPGGTILDVPVLGGKVALGELRSRGVRFAVNAVGGIGNIQSRVNVFHSLKQEDYSCPTVIHPTAYIESSATLDDGVQVFPNAYIGSEVSIGFGTIINTAAVVSHDCVIGAYTNIAPGTLLAGSVSTGESVLVGMGVTVNLQVSIGDHARIGNSAVIKENVPAKGVVRAGAIWPEPRHRKVYGEVE